MVLPHFSSPFPHQRGIHPHDNRHTQKRSILHRGKTTTSSLVSFRRQRWRNAKWSFVLTGVLLVLLIRQQRQQRQEQSSSLFGVLISSSSTIFFQDNAAAIRQRNTRVRGPDRSLDATPENANQEKAQDTPKETDKKASKDVTNDHKDIDNNDKVKKDDKDKVKKDQNVVVVVPPEHPRWPDPDGNETDSDSDEVTQNATDSTTNSTTNSNTTGASATATASSSGSDSYWKKPVQVFLLAGQSNMQGQGNLEALRELILAQDATPNKDHRKDATDDKDNNNNFLQNPSQYRTSLWDEEMQDFTIRKDVFCKYGPGFGNLTAGHGTQFAGQLRSRDRMGVELMMGHVLGNALNGCEDDHVRPSAADGTTKAATTTTTTSASTPTPYPIYLIKAAWGGRDLAIDFRPPSAKPGNYTRGFAGFTHQEKAQAEADRCEHAKGQVCSYGYRYQTMIEEFREGLKEMQKVIPGSTTMGYEIAGFVWLQGMGDIVDWQKTREYASNLQHLLADVRKELNQPNLPAVVAEVGNHGTIADCHNMPLSPRDVCQRVEYFRRSVQEVVEQDENAMYVPTARYALFDKVLQQEYGYKKPLKHYDKYFHYFGRPESYYFIGKDLGTAMVKMWRRRNQQNLEAHNSVDSRKARPKALREGACSGTVHFIDSLSYIDNCLRIHHVNVSEG